MPGISSVGNMAPASIIIMSSPHSRAVMFLPISPTPPMKMTLTAFFLERSRTGFCVAADWARSAMRFCDCAGGSMATAGMRTGARRDFSPPLRADDGF